MVKKQPHKPVEAWKGIPSPNKAGWQYLFLFNPRTGALAKIEVPKRYAFDKRGYEIPEDIKNVKVKGVKFAMHKRENEWDAKVAKRNLDRLLTNGFQIIPPSQIGIKNQDEANKFNPNRGKPMPKHNKGQQSQQGQGQPGQQGQPGSGQGQPTTGMIQRSTNQAQGQGQGQPNNQHGQFGGQANNGPRQPNNQTPRPANEGQSDESEIPKNFKKPESANQPSRDGRGSRPNESQHNKTEAELEAEKAQQGQEAGEGQQGQNGQDGQNGESAEEKAAREEQARQDAEAAKEVKKAADAAEAKAKTKTGSAANKPDDGKLSEKEKSYVTAKPKSERKHRGSRRRLGKRVVEVDRYAKGNAGDGSRVRGIYSYGDIVYNQKIANAASESVEILSKFIGKSQAMTEFGIRADIPDLVVRLESGDNPLPALERPNERPKMKIMVSPDCSPSTHDWNGLACAWAIALAKNPELDVLYVPNSNGEPVKVSEDRYLTLMRSSDIIIYLGDSDGMQHNIDWAKEHQQHVIALSSVQRSIGKIPDWKAKNDKVHLVVQKYGTKGVLRYATGVKSKVPGSWVKALQLCLDSLEDQK